MCQSRLRSRRCPSHPDGAAAVPHTRRRRRGRLRRQQLTVSTCSSDHSRLSQHSSQRQRHRSQPWQPHSSQCKQGDYDLHGAGLDKCQAPTLLFPAQPHSSRSSLCPTQPCSRSQPTPPRRHPSTATRGLTTRAQCTTRAHSSTVGASQGYMVVAVA